jgi:hypothetical protein
MSSIWQEKSARVNSSLSQEMSESAGWTRATSTSRIVRGRSDADEHLQNIGHEILHSITPWQLVFVRKKISRINRMALD